MLRRALVFALALTLVSARPASAYSVLTHEAIIDSVWDDAIAPILRARYRATPEQLLQARAYAYGGCIIQDMGYYPFSSRMFSDLVHYVRSGDFITALLREASNADEYAFALGALAHFAADNRGHPLAINRTVPMLYPKLQQKFGDVVTYEEAPSAHLKAEFGFDVVQVARGSYLPKSYHDFIGFRVSKPVLERAFKDTYGLELNDVFADVDLSIGTFRKAVSSLIPQMTKVAWATKQKEIEALTPGSTRERFLYSMPVKTYEQEWGASYSKPGPGHKIGAFFLKLVPKIGPLRSLSFKPPTPEAERLFLKSFEATVTEYRLLLASSRGRTVRLPNRNFDTGEPVAAGAYRLVDEVYAHLLEKLEHRHFESVPPAMRANILAFYHNPDAPISTKQDRRAWQKVQRGLDELKVSGPDLTSRPSPGGRRGATPGVLPVR